MNQDEATRYFDALGEGVSARQPSTADLITQGRAAERRKSRRTLALVAASVALVLGGGAVVQQAIAGDNPDEDVTAEVPTVPDGTRLVGMGRVVVAVPESWGTQLLNQCGRPAQATVWFPQAKEEPQTIECAGTESPRVPMVRILDLDSEQGRAMAEYATAEDRVNGLDVLRLPSKCGTPHSDPAPRGCIGEDVLVVPDHGVVFSTDPTTDETHVLDTLQLLPDGYTTVPYLPSDLPNGPAGNLLIHAGLEFEESPPTGMPTGRAAQFGTLPEAGSVVGVGSTVTLLLDRSPEPTCGEGEGPSDEPSVPRGPDYPTNPAGLTYGGTGDDGQEPDLVAVVGECGRTGYVYREQLDEPDPWSPEAGLDPTLPRSLPVYTSDGATQIDTFTLGGTNPAPETPTGPGSKVLQGDWSVIIGGVQHEDGTQAYDTFRDVAMTASVEGDLMRVFDGCQTWTSTFRLVDGEFSLTQPFVTEAPQPAAGCDRQAPLVDILGNIRHVSTPGAKVHLHLASFQIVLVLSAI